MVLIRCSVRLVLLGVLGVLGLAGCANESLFEGNGTVVKGPAMPEDLTCAMPCAADAAGDFNGTSRGTSGHWRYLDDHRDRSWTAMTPGAAAMIGADPANQITTCAANPGAAACKILPRALLISSSGVMSADDPAIEYASPISQVVQLSVHAYAAGGADQTVRVYRNSREDVLFTGIATPGVTLDQLITLDALAGDRFLVALAPVAAGASDIALHVFVNPTGAAFPSGCQVAVEFATAAGNTVDNLCGSDFTHRLFVGNMDTAPVLGPGPYTELGNAGDLAPDAYFATTGSLDDSHDVTLQFWVLQRGFVDSNDAWLFSNLDLVSSGGVAVAILNAEAPKLNVTTCDSVAADQITLSQTETDFPNDGSWQFVRVAHKGDQLYLCLNGVRQGLPLHVAPGHLASGFAPHLGNNQRWMPPGAFFDGELDDIRVMAGALPCD